MNEFSDPPAIDPQAIVVGKPSPAGAPGAPPPAPGGSPQGEQPSSQPDALGARGSPAPQVFGEKSPTLVPAGVNSKADGRSLVAQAGHLAIDQFGDGCFVETPTNANPVVYSLSSPSFEGLVRELTRQAGVRLNLRESREAIEALKAQAAHNGKPVKVSRRVARAANGDVVIALHDAKNTHIRISPSHVLVMSQGSEELFYKAPYTLPMAMPADTGDVQLLKCYVNLRNEMFVLYIAWVTYTLAHGKVLGTTFPLLVIVGGQGTGKSQLSKVTSAVVDPSSKGVERLPSSLNDLALAANSGHLVVYDNLQHLTAQQKDSLCIMATGGTVTTRQLYTNDALKVIQLHAAAVLNSIVGVVDQADLAQRSIVIRLEPMPESDRRSDSELWREFEADLPKIMRGLFDLIAKTLAHLPTAVVVKPQRLIDFVRWLAAMEAVAGIPAGLGPYQEAFAQIIDEGQLDSLQDNVVGAAVLEFADDLGASGKDWTGTPTELYDKLTEVVKGIQYRAPRGWPDNAIALSKRLLSLQAALLTQCIEVKFQRGKTRTITVRKIGGAQ